MIFLGRVLLAALFLAGALQKAMDPAPVQSLLAGQGWPAWMVWPALGLNAVGALALLVGVYPRSAAAGLALYCAVTSLFHFIPEDPWQMSIFVKNWAIAGGLLVLAGQGGGRWVLRPD